MGTKKIKFRDALAVKQYHSQELLEKDGVFGVGVGFVDPNDPKSGPAIILYTDDILSSKQKQAIPSELTLTIDEEEISVPTIVKGGGPFIATAPETIREYDTGTNPYVKKIRPVIGGYSIGKTTNSGTGGLVVINYPEKDLFFLLSNNHVVVKDNSSVYSPILQPGAADGGTINDKIGRSYDFVKLEPGSDNSQDSARVLPDQQSLLSAKYATLDVVPGHYEQYSVGWKMWKIGITTGKVEGTVEAVHVDVSVKYSFGVIKMKDQTTITGSSTVSEPGDSGSVWLKKEDNYACAVNYAAQNSWKTSLAFPINWFMLKYGCRVAKPSSTDDQTGKYEAGEVRNVKYVDDPAVYTDINPPTRCNIIKNDQQPVIDTGLSSITIKDLLAQWAYIKEDDKFIVNLALEEVYFLRNQFLGRNEYIPFSTDDKKIRGRLYYKSEDQSHLLLVVDQPGNPIEIKLWADL